MKWFVKLLLITLTTANSFGQDLDQLRTRAAEHWKQRVAGNTTGASQFVERANRSKFADVVEPQFLEAKITAFEFSETPRDVLVTIRTVSQLPIGKVNKTVAEHWVWSEGNWFLHLETGVSNNPFKVKPASPSVPSISFELLDSQLDLGKHVQGDEIKGAVRFKGNRPTIANIATSGVSSLRVSEVTWNDSDGGTLHFVIDSSLFSSRFTQDVTFTAIDFSGVQVSRNVTLTSEIAGRVEFRQTPDVVDPAKRGRVELELKNISQTPFRITGLLSSHPAFVLVEDQQLPAVNPGESLRLQIDHWIQPFPTEAGLLLTFADKFLPRSVGVPFKIDLPEPKEQPLVDPAVLDKILRGAKP